MRIRTTILTIILSLLFASVLPAAQRGIKVTAKTPSGKSIPLYSGSYALVIGNGDYTNGWDPLPGAIRDVKDVARALKENGFQVILKTNLTRNDFNRALGNFFYKYGRNKTNRLLFYYAGHGHTQQMFTDEALGYLVMVDAPPPEKDLVGFEMASVDMQSIVTQAKKTKAKHVLFMFDSCFSGSILNLRERVVPEAISDSVSLPVRQFITAGRANEPVPDHSIFKQAFLDLLEGRDKEPIPDGYITGEELGLYLKNKVPEYSPTQHPQYGKIKDIRLDKGDFVFQLPLSGAKEPAPTIPKAQKSTLDKEMLFWQSIQDSDSRELFEAYIEKFPNGFFAPIARQKIEALKQKKAVTSIPHEVSKSKLFVEVEPKDSRVRILNIRPNFYQGMELKPGRYHVEVSNRDHKTKKMWVNLGAGEEKRLDIRLERLQTSIQPTTTSTRPSSSTPGITTGYGAYVEYANGIVRDTKTGLDWISGSDTGIKFPDARSWVSNLATDGGGWRLPTPNELASLYIKNRNSRNIIELLKGKSGWLVWTSKKINGYCTYYSYHNNQLELCHGGIECACHARVIAVRKRK